MMLDALPQIANESRGVCFDMVSRANSGHLGLPLGCAECAAVLWGHFLRYVPKHPRWLNRDRFVLSAGHGSALLYTYLYLSGHEVTLEDLKQFRQQGSRTPGHPEFGHTLGVEATTGPLGQGIGNAVGLAVSQKKMAQAFNTTEYPIFNNCVVCLCGDGCLQEGVGQESIALAGVWKLDNLILIYDCNQVTLDGPLGMAQQEDVVQKFKALGWSTFEVDGKDCRAIAETLDRCRAEKGRPKVILLHTVIGQGLRVAGTHMAHGPAGVKEGAEVKRSWGLDPEQSFQVSESTRRFFAQREAQLQKEYQAWTKMFEAWCAAVPEKAKQLANPPGLPKDFFAHVPPKTQTISTRACAGQLLSQYAQQLPLCITGSADLFDSVKNYIADGGDFSPQNLSGRNLFFGIREHAMGAILNGLAYDGFFKVSGSTFFSFSDYLKPAIRVAALSRLPVWYFFSHDSIAVGEDGPTHQPVEQLAGFRSMPQVQVLRPADTDELRACFHCATTYDEGPSIFVLSRQDLPYLTLLPADEKFQGACRGAYVLQPEQGDLDFLLIATGSEVSLALETAARLGKHTRVVSMPSCEVFLRQPADYQEKILPKACRRRVAIEAAATHTWYRFVGLDGCVLGLDRFGLSAPAPQCFQACQLTPEVCHERILKFFSEAPAQESER